MEEFFLDDVFDGIVVWNCKNVFLVQDLPLLGRLGNCVRKMVL